MVVVISSRCDTSRRLDMSLVEFLGLVDVVGKMGGNIGSCEPHGSDIVGVFDGSHELLYLVCGFVAFKVWWVFHFIIVGLFFNNLC